MSFFSSRRILGKTLIDQIQSNTMSAEERPSLGFDDVCFDGGVVVGGGWDAHFFVAQRLSR